MKVFLDDIRTPPDKDWVLVRYPNEVVDLILAGGVTHISLDHDLGNDDFGTGYDVILWLEEQVYFDRVIPPTITIHSANPVGRKKMEDGIKNIYGYHKFNMEIKNGKREETNI